PRLVRIVCRELESWYIGDLEAVGKAFSQFKYQNYIHKAKFRIPDNCNAYQELKRMIPEFQKVSGARMIAPHIEVSRNRSTSFHQTISGILNFFENMED
ncbi:MAG: DUF4276 family protein, partial [Runella sp.]